MKKLLLPVLLLVSFCCFAQKTVRLFVIDPGPGQTLALKNFDAINAIDVSNYRLGAKGDSSGVLTSVSSPAFGSYVIPPSSGVVLNMNSNFILDDTSDLSLHLPASVGAMGDTATLLDFVQWKAPNHGGFEDQAVLKGYWTKNDYITSAPPYVYNGNSTQRGLPHWQTLILPKIGIRLCYVKPGEDIFALKNWGPSDYDISGLKICHKTVCYDSLIKGPFTLIKGTMNPAVGDTVVFRMTAIDDVEGDISVYLPSNQPDTASMLDFVQWGDSLQGHESLAIEKNIWGPNQFLTPGKIDSIVFFGDQDNRGYSKWATHFGIVSSNVTDVRLLYVRPGKDIIALKNFGVAPYNTGHLNLCSDNICVDSIGKSSVIALQGNKILSAGATVILTGLALGDSAGDVSLFFADMPKDTASMIDFVQWGNDGHGHHLLAKTKGIWGNGQFLKIGRAVEDSIVFFGNLLNRGFAFWRTDSVNHTGINKINTDFAGLSIYPNPANDLLTVSFNSTVPGTVILSIISLNGQEVYRSEQKMQAGEFSMEADLKLLSAGVYGVRLQSGESLINLKLVIAPH